MAHVLWLLGQDEQWMRPRVSALPAAAAAAAVVDVIASGAARWVDDRDEACVEPLAAPVAAGLVQEWVAQIREAATSGPLPVIHAMNAVSPGLWDSLGADLVRRGLAAEVPHRVRRWRPPRRRPTYEAADELRTHLRDVIRRARSATAQQREVLAVALSAGVVEHMLSRSAFTDGGVVEPTRQLLAGDALVDRLTPALSYVNSLGPVYGLPPWS